MGRLEKVARDSIDAWNAHDVNRILSFDTDDVVYEDVPFARVNRGKAEPKDFVLDMQPTGKTFSVRGPSVGEHLDGKLKRNSDYYDGAAFMQQIGLAPSDT